MLAHMYPPPVKAGPDLDSVNIFMWKKIVFARIWITTFFCMMAYLKSEPD